MKDTSNKNNYKKKWDSQFLKITQPAWGGCRLSWIKLNQNFCSITMKGHSTIHFFILLVKESLACKKTSPMHNITSK